jgi:flavin-dependent dehydrogenase
VTSHRTGHLGSDFDADLLVVGGGPAGLATALYARRAGMSVIVAEPRPSPVDKACGEGLMPGGLAALAALGVDPQGVPLRGIAYVDGSSVDGSRRVEAEFRSGPGRGVRRTVLHSALTARARQAGTQWTVARVREVSQDRGGVSAAGLRARWMVAADGLHSGVRRYLGVRSVAGSPRRFGVRRHFGTPAWSSFVEVWWSPLGEAYVTPVSEGVVGVAILGGGRVGLSAFPGLQSRLEGAPVIGPVRGAGPLRRVVSRRVCGRVLFVGDAAGYEDALTGEGISLAVKQAGAAVEALVAARPALYEASWRRITREYRWLTRGLVLATAPPLLRRAIVPLSGFLPGVFGAVVNRLAR